jgi:hypothetical protein
VVVLAVYLVNGSTATPAQALPHIEPHGFQNAYVTGTAPPVNFSFTPYTFMIDLEKGTVLGKAGMLFGFPVTRIKTLATEASDD